MTQTIAPILRLAGLAIEIICLALWLAASSRPGASGSMTVRLLLAGVGLGFVLWLVGMILIRIEARRASASKQPDSR